MDTEKILISSYKNVYDDKPKDQNLEAFLHDVLMGTWEDIVMKARTISDKKERAKYKQSCPLVTISGSFKDRSDSGLRKHSGYIAIDIDDLEEDLNTVKSLLGADQYVYAFFTSISGNGLCVIFKIDGEKHLQAFEGIAHYLYENYQIIVDPSGKNISRARFVSFDPELYQNPKALQFRKYLPKKKPPKVPKIVYVQSDFEQIIKDFSDRAINITEHYNEWLSVGFSLISKFGASQEGRDYFHILSAISDRYDRKECDKKYDLLLRGYSENREKTATIASIYYHARQNGIETYSDRTKQIISATSTMKKSGVNSASIAENLQKFEDIPISESADIINQAYANNIDISGEESIVAEVERWLKYNCDLRRNEITRKIENYGTPLESKEFNTLFINCKKVIEKIDYSLFERIILSDYTPSYNPLLEFFEMYKDRNETGLISRLANTLDTNNKEFTHYFIKKWIVGAISAAHGHHSPLMLILASPIQNSGKTEWFRRLLPPELKPYYAESKLDAGKDDEILMTNKWFIMDDEMGGKSKKEAARLKELTSKQTFSLREPYGRSNVDLTRLAVLCGTSNELDLINDPTGNRRLIPIEVNSINHMEYNRIDKVDLLMEAYHLYKSGFDWKLNKEDIDTLKANTHNMNYESLEFGLINKYFEVPENGEKGEYKTATEIKVFLDNMTHQKTYLKKIGEELKAIGFIQEVKWVNGKTSRVYKVAYRVDPEHIIYDDEEQIKAPF